MTSRRAAVLLALLGAGLTLLAGTRGWATAPVTGVPGGTQVSVTGREAAPVVVAVALAAAAGGVVLGFATRVVRYAVAAGLLLAGAAIVAAALGVVTDPGGAVATAVVEATGVRGAGGVPGARVTAWPWTAVAGGVLTVAAGVLGLVRGRSWPGPTRRYDRADRPSDRPSDRRPDRAPADATGTWDALSRGEDPT